MYKFRMIIFAIIVVGCSSTDKINYQPMPITITQSEALADVTEILQKHFNKVKVNKEFFSYESDGEPIEIVRCYFTQLEKIELLYNYAPVGKNAYVEIYYKKKLLASFGFSSLEEGKRFVDLLYYLKSCRSNSSN